jgi:hypothetical protein
MVTKRGPDRVVDDDARPAAKRKRSWGHPASSTSLQRIAERSPSWRMYR